MNISEVLIDIRYPRPMGELFPICIVARLSIAFSVVGRTCLRMDKLSLGSDVIFSIFRYILLGGYMGLQTLRVPHQHLASCVNPEEVLIPVAKPRQSTILLRIYLGIEALLLVI